MQEEMWGEAMPRYQHLLPCMKRPRACVCRDAMILTLDGSDAGHDDERDQWMTCTVRQHMQAQF